MLPFSNSVSPKQKPGSSEPGFCFTFSFFSEPPAKHFPELHFEFGPALQGSP
jgi:hypothetical protein